MDYGCPGEGNWKSLDGYKNSSQTESCERLCRQEYEDGCCYLSDEMGCMWVRNASSGFDDGQMHVVGAAVTCQLTGTGDQI